jgi:hypothetical protein
MRVLSTNQMQQSLTLRVEMHVRRGPYHAVAEARVLCCQVNVAWRRKIREHHSGSNPATAANPHELRQERRRLHGAPGFLAI